MAIHIDNLASHVAALISNLGKGIKQGQEDGGCTIVINAAETELQISGEVVYSEEFQVQREMSSGKNPKISTEERPYEVKRSGQREYSEDFQDGGVVNESIGMDQSVTRNFETFVQS